MYKRDLSADLCIFADELCADKCVYRQCLSAKKCVYIWKDLYYNNL